MKSKALVFLAMAAGLLTVSSPLLSHHGMSWADNEHPITVTGTVVSFAFVNPHVQMVMDVKNAEGTVDRWDIEMPAPETLHRAGWTASSIKVGDTVAASGGPAKDGRHLMASRKYKVNGVELPTRE